MLKRFSLLLLSASSLIASPVGNTAAPELIQKGIFMSRSDPANLRIGYEGDFVTDARLDLVNGNPNRVDGFQQYTNSGTVTLNFLNRLDLYAVLGSSELDAKWRYASAFDSIYLMEINTNRNFLWALGGRAIFYEWLKTDLGLGGRYSSANYSLCKLSQNGVHLPVAGAQCLWDEWQINLDISYKISLFTPYIGVKYSNTVVNCSFPGITAPDNPTKDEFKTRTPVGLYLGCALSSGKYFMANLEGRLIDEEAVTLSADIRF